MAHPGGIVCHQRTGMTDNSEVLHGSAERSVRLARQIVEAVFVMAILLGGAKTAPAVAQTTPQSKFAGNVACHVESIDYKGWKAQQISNRWVQLIIVAQNGGRQKKSAIVALARKLLVALWKYVNAGIAIEGAVARA